MARHPLAALVLLALAGCATVKGDYPSSWSLLPNASLNISDGLAISLNDLVAGGLVIGAIYYITDPQAPNWSIREQRVAEDRLVFDLSMKRFHAAGEGEALQVMRRQAHLLAVANGFKHYEVAHWEESIESNWIARRHARGEVRLLR